MTVGRLVRTIFAALIIALGAAASIPRATEPEAASFTTYQKYVKDTYGHKSARWMKVDHGGWFDSGGFSTFNLWYLKAYSNIYHSPSQFYYAGFWVSSYGYGTRLDFQGVSLTFYNTPTFVEEEYLQFFDTQDPFIKLTGITNGETALAWRWATAWDEVTAPYNSSNLYYSGSGTYTAFP